MARAPSPPAPTGDTVTCDLGRLRRPVRATTPGASGRVTIVASVPADVAPGDYPNVATADGAVGAADDQPAGTGDRRGPRQRVDHQVVPARAPDPEITPGTTETYRIRVVNDGPSVADDVVVTDALPDRAHRDRVAGRLGDAARPDAGVRRRHRRRATSATSRPGTTVELELDVVVDDDLVIDPDVGVTNTATVDLGHRRSQRRRQHEHVHRVGVTPQADLSIRKIAPAELADRRRRRRRHARQPVVPSSRSSTSDRRTATDITFTDTLPPGVTFVRFYDADEPGLRPHAVPELHGHRRRRRPDRP